MWKKINIQVTNCRTDIIINILFMFIFDCPFFNLSQCQCHIVSIYAIPLLLYFRILNISTRQIFEMRFQNAFHNEYLQE